MASLSPQDSELAHILAYQGPPGAVWSQANHLRFGFDPLTWTIRELLVTDKRFVSGLPLLIIVVDGPKCILLFRFYRAFTACFCHLFSHLSLNYMGWKEVRPGYRSVLTYCVILDKLLNLSDLPSFIYMKKIIPLHRVGVCFLSEE